MKISLVLPQDFQCTLSWSARISNRQQYQHITLVDHVPIDQKQSRIIPDPYMVYFATFCLVLCGKNVSKYTNPADGMSNSVTLIQDLDAVRNQDTNQSRQSLGFLHEQQRVVPVISW